MRVFREKNLDTPTDPTLLLLDLRAIVESVLAYFEWATLIPNRSVIIATLKTILNLMED